MKKPTEGQKQDNHNLSDQSSKEGKKESRQSINDAPGNEGKAEKRIKKTDEDKDPHQTGYSALPPKGNDPAENEDLQGPKEGD